MAVPCHVCLTAHFGLVGADVDSGFCELPKGVGERGDRGWWWQS